jgi:hypothetical protein
MVIFFWFSFPLVNFFLHHYLRWRYILWLYCFVQEISRKAKFYSRWFVTLSFVFIWGWQSHRVYESTTGKEYTRKHAQKHLSTKTYNETYLQITP